MNPKKLVETFTGLHAKLSKNGPSALLKIERQLLETNLSIFKAQLHYEKLKIKNPNIYVEFFEGDSPLSLIDRENITKATALNRQIGKTLAELKRSKQ